VFNTGTLMEFQRVFFPLYWVSKEGNPKKKSKKEREGGEREVFVPNSPFQYWRCEAS
jgi:hypothetical protein